MKLNKNKRGISLIVLVITIIIMIILAAAIILSLNGSGIIGKANEATKVSDMANAKNVVAVAKAEWALEKVEGYDDFSDYAMAKLAEAGFKTSGRGSYEVTNDGIVYAYPTIPSGFTASIYEGEQNILDGLVIYETDSLDRIAKETAMETYNQYVWVPVEGVFERIPWKNKDLTNEYVEPIKDGIDYMDNITNYKDEIEQYNTIKASVEKYGGFYIARYETGKEIIGSTEIPVSKKGATVWNSIEWDLTWSGTGYGVDTNDGVAKISKDDISYSNAVRHLIYGVEWDQTLNFISKNDSEYIVNSDGRGWNKLNYELGNIDHKTGIDLNGGANKVNNIYDMMGNMWEFTYEVYTQSDNAARVMRGGCYQSDRKGHTAATRSYYYPNSGNAHDGYGFRMALYIK